MDYSIRSAVFCLAAGVSSEVQKHRPSETRLEQMLGLDQTLQELINGAIEQWCKRLFLVVRLHE